MPKPLPKLPNLSHLPTKPEDITFSDHPDNCDAIFYGNEFYFALVGGAQCKCAPGEGNLKIYDTLSIERNSPTILFEHVYDTREEAIRAAQMWLANSHKALQEELEHLKGVVARLAGVELPAASESSYVTPAKFKDRMLDKELVELFLANEKAALVSLGDPLNKGDENMPKFSYPIFTQTKKYEA